ncbi:hypothetical protein EBB06_06105 [Crenobacter cavernae]|uniref:Solute-binding protein family 3/N-terminal domain-containing protein n=1 Tax=Crenobacter cavernae TaxID=2290923 RepID=A0ABY0FFJ3_9NEIS|nr:hypothetical protein EBB06_06105 [Crenobacter cavernae]
MSGIGDCMRLGGSGGGLVALLWGGLALAAAGLKPLVIGVERFDHSPHFDGSHGDYRGFARELFDLFGKSRGYAVQYRALPIPDLYQAFFVSHDVDAKFPDNPSWMPARRKPFHVSYSAGVIDFTEGVMLRSAALGKEVSTLRRLGTIQGFDAVPYRQKIQTGQMTVSRFGDVDSMLQAAVKGEIDGAYLNVAVAAYRLRQAGQADALQFNPEWPHAVGSYALSSVTRPDVIRDFDAFLHGEKAAIDQLRKKHGIVFLPPVSASPRLAEPAQRRALTSRPYLTLCHDHLPPYAVGHGRWIGDGSKFSATRRVFREAGLQLRVLQLPWARCLSEAALGRVDGVLPTFRTSEREQKFVFSEPVVQQEMAFFYAREHYPDGLGWKSYSELRGARLGMLLGGSVDTQMERTLAEGGVVNRVVDAETLMRLLALGRLDLVALDRQAGLYELQRLGLGKRLAASEKPVSVRPAAIALSRESGAAQLMPRINAAIARLRAQGRLAGG